MTYTEPDAIAAIARAIKPNRTTSRCGARRSLLRGAGRRRAANQLAEHRARCRPTPRWWIQPTPPTPPGFTRVADNESEDRALGARGAECHSGVYADVASVTEGADRATAIAWAQASARDAVRLGAASQAFPT